MCNASILYIKSRVLSDMGKDVERVTEMTLNFTLEDVDAALDYIYGSVMASNKSGDVTEIPFKLYGIFVQLGVEDLMHHSYYRKRFVDFDVEKLILDIGQPNRGQPNGNPDNRDMMIEAVKWLKNDSRSGPYQILNPIAREICRIAASCCGSRQAYKFSILIKDLQIEHIQFIFEEMNEMISKISISDNWRVDFLRMYSTDENFEEVADKLLTRVDMIPYLMKSKLACDDFVLKQDAATLAKFQLDSGYFYCEGSCTFEIKEAQIDCNINIRTLDRTTGVILWNHEYIDFTLPLSYEDILLNVGPTKWTRKGEVKETEKSDQCSIM